MTMPQIDRKQSRAVRIEAITILLKIAENGKIHDPAPPEDA